MAKFITLTEQQKEVARQLGISESILWAQMSLEALAAEEPPRTLSEVDRLAVQLRLESQELRRLIVEEKALS